MDGKIKFQTATIAGSNNREHLISYFPNAVVS